MKKLILFVSFLILLISSFCFKPVFYDLFSVSDLFFSDITYSFYCLNYNKNLSAEIINNGAGYIIKTDGKNIKNVKNNLTGLLGESVSFKTTKNKIEKVLKTFNVNVIKEEKIGEIYCLYGYSHKLKTENSVLVENYKVNIQIAFINNILTIGTPIILGDY